MGLFFFASGGRKVKSESQQEAVASWKCERDSYVRTDGEVELLLSVGLQQRARAS